MELWQVLVLGVLKQGLGCDFDRLHDLANHHETIRAFLGHSEFGDRTRYEYQRVVDNVSLLTPELLSAVGQLVVESGHKVAKKKPGEPLRGRCDSFVVETDVHYPTDVSLLWDAMRCLLRETGRASGEHAVGGWRQWRYLTREVRSLFNRVRSTRRAKRHPERVEAYLARCRGLVERAVDTLDALRNPGVDAVTCDSIEGYVAHALRQIDQVERRLAGLVPPCITSRSSPVPRPSASDSCDGSPCPGRPGGRCAASSAAPARCRRPCSQFTSDTENRSVSDVVVAIRGMVH